jgi:tetratricopeptide (TPR) repeat protein
MARWQTKVDRLFWTGTAAQQSGEVAAALAAHRLAEGELRGRLRRHPDDPAVHEKLASVLYSLGSSLVVGGQPGEAAKVLHDSEHHYRRSAATDVELLIADVQARRAGAHTRAGHPVSALTDIDQALTTYAVHGVHLEGPPRSLDLARVLSQAAVVHRVHGDADQALNCAGQAMARYNEGYAAVNENPPAHLGYAIGMAADTASALEAAKGNWSTALAIDDMVLKVVEQGWGDLAAALARKGVHLRAAGRAAEAQPFLARAAELSGTAVEREQRILTEPRPRTLDEALRTAGAATGLVGVAVLRRALTAEESFSATARVRDPAAAPAHARRLADVAAAVDPDTDGDAAWRLALESHLLYHALFRKRADFGPGLRAYGDAWATALRVMVRVSGLHGGEAMQGDVRAAVDHFTEKTAPVADEPRLRTALDALRAETA